MPPSTTADDDFKKLSKKFNKKIAELEALSKELSEFSIEHEVPFCESEAVYKAITTITDNVNNTYTVSTDWQSSHCEGWESSHC